MLSRVQQLDQVYILDSLDETKIRTSPIGLRELLRLKENSINENPTPWLKTNEDSIKVVSLNCAGLKPHFVDIQADEHLLKADVIHLVETSLNENETAEFSIPGVEDQACQIWLVCPSDMVVCRDRGSHNNNQE